MLSPYWPPPLKEEVVSEEKACGRCGFYNHDHDRGCEDNVEAPPLGMTDLMVAPESWDICEKCGEVIPQSGAWPYCVSRTNPGGHSSQVAYGFRTKMGMKVNGWNRSKV